MLISGRCHQIFIANTYNLTLYASLPVDGAEVGCDVTVMAAPPNLEANTITVAQV